MWSTRLRSQKDGKTYRRTPEVLDCWFESGSMPYAQQHYPFAAEAGEGGQLDSFFPAQFIAEGLDQTRGWFYTLLVLGTSLFGKSPYENVIVNGLISRERRQKNVEAPQKLPRPERGARDVSVPMRLRAYMIDSPVVRAEELRFDEAGLKEIVRTVVLPYWNVLSFFTTYASIDGYDPRTWEAAPGRGTPGYRPMDPLRFAESRPGREYRDGGLPPLFSRSATGELY